MPRLPPQGAAYPQFSPDGTSIVYDLHRGGEVDVRIVPVTGGKSVPLVGGTLGTFSPDGSTFAVECGQFADGICIADADGTKPRVLVRSRSVEPKWSPDGTRIAYLNPEYNPDNRVFVVDVATGETTFVAEGTRGRLARRPYAHHSAPDIHLDAVAASPSSPSRRRAREPYGEPSV